jgi:hypothetical protein
MEQRGNSNVGCAMGELLWTEFCAALTGAGFVVSEARHHQQREDQGASAVI